MKKLIPLFFISLFLSTSYAQTADSTSSGTNAVPNMSNPENSRSNSNGVNTLNNTCTPGTANCNVNGSSRLKSRINNNTGTTPDTTY